MLSFGSASWYNSIFPNYEVKGSAGDVFSITDKVIEGQKVKNHPLKTCALFPVPSSVRQLAQRFLETMFICSFIQEFSSPS